ncbi:uncharacterized protein LOC110060022 isoform X3 [Orbicella faveolata]|uniref:uncharacterized protein LOC110060022 isoform X3 n=1 Tax=Orbicella faveolata TaxID=48498 RepID=UPI0009E4C43B|nr:uncharacterized protein LOC110060022 isoform X3 [Orbicella faveolata]
MKGKTIFKWPLIDEVKDRITESSKMRKVSGTTVAMASTMPQIVEIEHCALMGPRNQWVMMVLCRTSNGARDICGNALWESLLGRYLDAKVEVKHNSVTVNLPPIQNYLEIAVFGTPGENDMIRKQVAIFGPKPEKGQTWTINTILYDDTVRAFEQLRQKERERGNKLLTARSGLFVANIEDDINIELSALQPGWRIKGSEIKVIKSRDAWKIPENGTNFPRCSCEIVHVDETKESFICGITVSHGEETTKAEVVAIFKQIVGAHISDKKRKKKIQEENLITSDKLKRVLLLVAISCALSLIVAEAVLTFTLSNARPEAEETMNEKPKAEFAFCNARLGCRRFIMAKFGFAPNKMRGNYSFSKLNNLKNCSANEIGGVRANYQSRLLNQSDDSQRQGDLTDRGQAICSKETPISKREIDIPLFDERLNERRVQSDIFYKS